MKYTLRAVLLLCAAGCGAQSDGAAAATARDTIYGEGPSAALRKRDWDPGLATAAVRGRVRLLGTAPPRRKEPLGNCKFCRDAHPDGLYTENVLVGPAGGLKNVFVWVKQGLEGWRFPVPKEPAVLDQVACRYVPRVLGLQTGQALRILNSDATTHNVHALPVVNEGFNQSMTRKGGVLSARFRDPEVWIPLQCQIHGYMSAYIGVVPHPFFAVTEADGSFVLPKLPSGKYTIEIVHEFYGRKTHELEVKDGEQRRLELAFGTE